MRVHYPRTPHLPWSPGATPDDLRVSELSGLVGRDVVITEKLDGENTTLYPDGLHARSLDSPHHPSRTWIKALHGRIARRIPAGWRVCGENMFARHSLAYDDLHSWFYAFSVWAGDRCLDWDTTVRFATRLGVPVAPVLWRGRFDERAIRALRVDTDRHEGYVVRTVAGFDRAEFGCRVAKWVRHAHVTTDVHWASAPVVPNGRGPSAPLWDVRSGGSTDVAGLAAAVGATADDLDGGHERLDEALGAVLARLDGHGRAGDARLAGVLATLLHGCRRAVLGPRLAGSLGMPLARRVADLVGLYPTLGRPFPDEERRSGLLWLAEAADLAVLHAVAEAVLGAEDSDGTAQEQVGWSALYAEDSGLLGEDPLGPLRAGMREALCGLPADVADRCWAESRAAYAAGRIASAAEGAGLSWRWRGGEFPRLVIMSGPAGSGKSVAAAGWTGVDEIVSMDDLRAARGDRGDQRANAEVLRTGLNRLDGALAAGRTVVWDATGINRQRRGVVQAVGRRHDALVTTAALLVPPEVVVARNDARADRVPLAALRDQLHRFGPPYPGESHRTWYLGERGSVEDAAGSLCDGES